MTEYGGDFWVAHLLFRDYLQSHEDLAHRYEDLKRHLFDQLAPEPDRAAYNDGKSTFINCVLEQARAEVE